MNTHNLIERVETRAAQIGVIGLGYVGFPVACILAQQGFKVLGLDINAERVAAIQDGISPVGGDEPGLAELVAAVTHAGALHATTNYKSLNSVDIAIVCVDTPVDSDTHYPAYRALRSVLMSLGEILQDPTNQTSLIIIESTLAPGTMTDVVIPTLEQASGQKAGERFWVGHCPERVTPGKLLYNLIHVNRTVGGQTPETVEVMKALYRSYVNADLDGTDLLSAEIVKTAENAYRDVQIAFANELALICEALGADVYTVREMVNKSPGRSVHMPGAGVGGHCIPKDPWLLIANVQQRYQARLIPAARALNSYMPIHMADLVEQGLKTHEVPLMGARIAVLGYAFREDTDDDRDSPTMYLIDELIHRGAIPVVHDPFVPAYRKPLMEVVQGAHALALMVAHTVYRNLDIGELRRQMAYPILIDGRHVISKQEAQALGFTYRGVGT